MKTAAALLGVLAAGLAIYGMVALLERGIHATPEAPERLPALGETLSEPPPELAAGPSEGAGVPLEPATTSEEPAMEEPLAPLPDTEGATCLVVGRITDENGVAVANPAGLTLYDAEETELRARADGEGRYSVGGLRPGRWRLVAWSEGHVHAVEHVDLVPGNLPRTVDFRLRSATVIHVRVVAPDGRPLREAAEKAGAPWYLLPVATREPPGPRFSEFANPLSLGVFRANGSGSASALPAEYIGILVLEEQPPLHVSLLRHEAVMATQLVEAGVDEVAFVVDPELLRAAQSGLVLRLVRAATEEPVSDGHALLETPTSGKGLTCDPDGYLRKEDLAPGDYFLRVDAPGLQGVRRELQLPAGSVLDLGTIRLEPARSITATVVGPSGEPRRASFELALRQGNPSEIRFDQGGTFLHQCDDAGRLTIRGLGAEDYVLRKWTDPEKERPDAARIIEVSTLQGSVDDVVIRLEPTVRLSLQPARGLQGVWSFHLRDAGGYPIASGRISPERGRRCFLPPSTYALELASPAGETSTLPVALTGDLTISIGP